MAEIAAWNGHSFTVSPYLIRGFTGLTIKGGSETKDKTSGGQKYLTHKSANADEISLTAELNAFTGCDVQNEALAFLNDARAGAKDYFYIGGKKLIPCRVMLTEASVTETQIAPGGQWTACKVQLTMKQCEKHDGAGGGKRRRKKKTVKGTKWNEKYYEKRNEAPTVTIVNPRKKTGLDACVAAVKNAKKASWKKLGDFDKKIVTGKTKPKVPKR
jgi:hypothetical protein